MAWTLGALQIAFEKLKGRLNKEGLFDPSTKKKLPLLPSRVGVVTSPHGAAIQDILRVLRRRNDRLNILIYPARVQGAEAPAEIVRGIQYLDRLEDIDVIIVGRGGGSWEDLWAFNEEIVARAIFEAETPVISAVGHEIDYTIADFVADARAATPSAAAEVVSGTREELRQAIAALSGNLRQAIRLVLASKRGSLQRLASNRGFVDAESRLRLYAQRLDELSNRLGRVGPNTWKARREHLSGLTKDFLLQTEFRLQEAKKELEGFNQQLAAYSPLAVLERGYAIVSRKDGWIVRSPADLSDEEVMDVRVSEGSFRARKED
jgi:exodeoxyribonuclease VII large subunit